MNILLISPADGRYTNTTKKNWLFRGNTFRFSLLGPLSVAAATPEHHHVRIIDEQLDSIPWDEPVDLVGISCMTALSPRAYEISQQFRQRGIPVVLGGMHPTLCSEEAVEHADAIVVGDAEDTWPQLLADLEQGRLMKIYRSSGAHSLNGLKEPPRHLMNDKHYSTINAVQATRGCPHHCDFCSVSAFHKATHRKRPVEEVAAEVAQIKDRFIMFTDDNLTADAEYAKDLCRALTPLKKKWVTQSSLAVTNDMELVELAAQSGCFGFFIGLETFNQNNLELVDKNFNKVEKYRKGIDILHNHGIGVEAGIVFGFDGDGPGVFQETLKITDELEIDVAQIAVYTPLPGTPRYEKIKHRIFDHNRLNYDFHHVVFEPKGMSARELQAGHDWFARQFYSPSRIAKRVLRHSLRPHGLSTAHYVGYINMGYYGRVKQWNLQGFNPAELTGHETCTPQLQCSVNSSES